MADIDTNPFQNLVERLRERARRRSPGHGFDGSEAEWDAEMARAGALEDVAEIIEEWVAAAMKKSVEDEVAVPASSGSTR